MAFSETPFLFIFLPVVLLCYFNPIIKTRKFKNCVLLIASIGFYGYGEPIFLFVMFLFSLINWAMGLVIERFNRRKFILTIAICLDLMLLVVYKYFNFICDNLFEVLNCETRSIIRIAMPIGISFFTFQMMSYLFDIYYCKTKAQKNPMKVLLYITMFPQLIAGPIVRYMTIENEIDNRKENQTDFTDGVRRFVFGLSKKVLIADYLALLADNTFADYQTMSVATLWLGAIAYTFQIYFDFSGYSDMAIGLGKIFGFHFPENFNYPYMAKSITEFWRRWHMSLSTWFKDYVYIPLGGSKRGLTRQIFNMLIVWILTGIWHGANWTFICWGLIYFLVLTCEKVITNIYKKENSSKSKSIFVSVLQHIYTMFIIIIAWVLFRSDSINTAVTYIHGMFFGDGRILIDGTFWLSINRFKWILVIAFVFSMPLVKNYIRKLQCREYVISIVTIVLMLLSVIICSHSTYSPFIYFNF